MSDRPVAQRREGEPPARPCLIDRCASSAPMTILVATALMIPVVAVIDALRG